MEPSLGEKSRSAIEYTRLLKTAKRKKKKKKKKKQKKNQISTKKKVIAD